MRCSFIAGCILALWLCSASTAAAQAFIPKRELRAVWVATVNNIDYPRFPKPDPASLQAEYLQLLDGFQALGINTVILQVRPAGDAFYPSRYAPWSAFLTGKQGLAPEGDFDPLAFYVKKTHERGMEFHAWLNPYRATTGLDTLSLAPSHVFHQHRDWLLCYGDQLYFNPARPEVRQHLFDIVTELLENYDIDAVHFDDYFYPYKVPGENFPDSTEYRRFRNGFTDIGDWRRDNTNRLVQGLAERIRSIRPHVRFGISPFGVWRNADTDPEGSLTRAGATSYDDLYADIRHWLFQGWIDYVAPQLYWHGGFELADFRTLLQWWGTNSYGRQLYIGHAAYKVGNNAQAAWDDPGELPRQVRLTRLNEASSGSVFFRAANLFVNPLGVADSLKQLYRYPALLPASAGPFSSQLHAPQLRKARRRGKGVRISWRPAEADADNPPAYYVVYRFRILDGPDFNHPKHIAHISPIGIEGGKFEYIDKEVTPNTLYMYAVTAVNRYHVESPPSKGAMVRAR